ncbi:hypothetical protein [Streptomyces sp. WAC05374]|uniref:hypothetical protein n=1 Tax=Streptomyces sp. WAC05374 TaxID=2487420 RepID=UPI000F871628|nr:hypothetical protein [Streptomyces sp. WAC05374]RST10734.1 hypothetical protein EF905_26660 [Streptomyces sp. WAC05374]
MRTLSLSGVLVAAAACSLVFAPSALATNGDNGTVKIHDASTGEELRRNEPHVCTFYLDAFGFDAGQQVDWHIEAWAPKAGAKGETVESGSLTLDGSGHGRTGDLTLPDGHYKLFWTFEGEHGRAKHKVFWSACDTEPGGGHEPGGSGPGSSGPGGSEPGERPSGGPSDTAPSAPSAPGAPAASAPGGSGGDLAETGSSAPVGVLAGIAGALVVGGGYLVSRLGRAKKQP